MITKLLPLLLVLISTNAASSTLKSNESVVLIPTYGHFDATSQQWRIRAHLWVFEQEAEDLFNRFLLRQLTDALDLTPKSAQNTRFRHIIAPFLADNQGNKQVTIQSQDATFQLGPTRANGHIRQEILLPATVTDRRVEFSVTLRPTVTSMVELIPATGVSIISDIDDTIKISEVTDKKKLLRNTFLEPYRAAPDMSTLYQAWRQQGAVFHYLSASPWQLFAPLHDFLRTQQFPDGSVHLRHLRLKDRSILNLLHSSQAYKQQHIETILADFPQRDFILVGDSGESDPLIYAQVAKNHPDQIKHIYIRRVTTHAPEHFAAIFNDLPSAFWTVFEDATKLPKGLDEQNCCAIYRNYSVHVPYDFISNNCARNWLGISVKVNTPVSASKNTLAPSIFR